MGGSNMEVGFKQKILEKSLKLKEGTQVSSAMMEETDISYDRIKKIISTLTSEQFQKLRKHYNTDSFPKEKTLQALAEELKVPKEAIEYWFVTQRNRESRRRQLWESYNSWVTRPKKNSKECSQNDPGLRKALRDLKRLKLSSGYESRDGMKQDF